MQKKCWQWYVLGWPQKQALQLRLVLGWAGSHMWRFLRDGMIANRCSHSGPATDGSSPFKKEMVPVVEKSAVQRHAQAGAVGRWVVWWPKPSAVAQLADWAVRCIYSLSAVGIIPECSSKGTQARWPPLLFLSFPSSAFLLSFLR